MHYSKILPGLFPALLKRRDGLQSGTHIFPLVSLLSQISEGIPFQVPREPEDPQKKFNIRGRVSRAKVENLDTNWHLMSDTYARVPKNIWLRRRHFLIYYLLLLSLFSGWERNYYGERLCFGQRHIDHWHGNYSDVTLWFLLFWR